MCVARVATVLPGKEEVLTKLQVAYDKLRRLVGRPLQRYPNRGNVAYSRKHVLRRFTSPFGGTAEVVGYCSATLTGLALVYSQKRKARIAIDIITGYFNRRVRAVVQAIGFLLGTVIFSMAAWQIFARAGKMHRSGVLSDTLQIAYYPLLYVLGCCVVFFAIRVFID